MYIDFIVAIDNKFGIAKQSKLPWRNDRIGKEDMKRFKQITMYRPIIMGRKTYETLKKPLKNRINIVISSKYKTITTFGINTDSPIVYIKSYNDVLKYVKTLPTFIKLPNLDKNPIIIGGNSLYKACINDPRLRFGYVGKINKDYNCDCFLEIPIEPLLTYDDSIGLPIFNSYTINDISYKMYRLDYRNKHEYRYLNLLKKLLSADQKPNRTSQMSRSLFHEVLKFPLMDERGKVMPLLTTKKMSWEIIFREAIWFLSGKCTNTSYLKKHNIKIWDGNSSAKYLKSRNLNYNIGEVGPQYGYQWRTWNKPYIKQRFHEISQGDCYYRDPSYKIIDQIENAIHLLKNDPNSRRIVISAWNPEQLDQMALQPCHYSFQFVCTNDKLNCLVNMRSADVALGVPFNIASYALITHIIAELTNKIPNELSISMADCHIYENHINGIRQQLKNHPYRFPTINIDYQMAKNLYYGGITANISKNTINNMISNYVCYKRIKFDMVSM